MKRFPYGKTAIVGFGFLGISIIWPIFNQYVPLFLQAGNPQFEAQLLASGSEIPKIVGFGLAPSLALFIMTWDNLLNVFVQPWIGARSDRTWNRFGRRKGYILLGLPIALVGFLLLPFAQTAVALAAFILITNFGMAIFRSPTVAWLGDLYPAEERSQANGMINLMGGVGGLLAFLGGGILFNQFGRSAPFIGGGILLVAAMAAALWGVTEPAQRATDEPSEEGAGLTAVLRHLWANPDKRLILLLVSILFWFMGFNALEAGLSSFAVFTLGISPGTASIYAASITLSFIACAAPAGILGAKYGRPLIIRWGLVGLALVFGLGYFIINGTAAFIAILVLGGIFWALVNVNSLPLVYDLGGAREVGALTGLYYFSSQSAAVLGPTLGGIVVDVLSDNYRWLFAFGAICMALAWGTMFRSRKP